MSGDELVLRIAEEKDSRPLHEGDFRIAHMHVLFSLAKAPSSNDSYDSVLYMTAFFKLISIFLPTHAAQDQRVMKDLSMVFLKGRAKNSPQIS